MAAEDAAAQHTMVYLHTDTLTSADHSARQARANVLKRLTTPPCLVLYPSYFLAVQPIDLLYTYSLDGIENVAARAL